LIALLSKPAAILVYFLLTLSCSQALHRLRWERLPAAPAIGGSRLV